MGVQEVPDSHSETLGRTWTRPAGALHLRSLLHAEGHAAHLLHHLCCCMTGWIRVHAVQLFGPPPKKNEYDNGKTTMRSDVEYIFPSRNGNAPLPCIWRCVSYWKIRSCSSHPQPPFPKSCSSFFFHVFLLHLFLVQLLLSSMRNSRPQSPSFFASPPLSVLLWEALWVRAGTLQWASWSASISLTALASCLLQWKELSHHVSTRALAKCLGG